jgi:hypothetical protein
MLPMLAGKEIRDDEAVLRSRGRIGGGAGGLSPFPAQKLSEGHGRGARAFRARKIGLLPVRGQEPTGSFTAWLPDGKPWIQGQYAVGFKTGKWKQWNASGNLVAEGDYRSGRLVAGAPVAAMAGCERVATK